MNELLAIARFLEGNEYSPGSRFYTFFVCCGVVEINGNFLPMVSILLHLKDNIKKPYRHFSVQDFLEP